MINIWLAFGSTARIIIIKKIKKREKLAHDVYISHSKPKSKRCKRSSQTPPHPGGD